MNFDNILELFAYWLMNDECLSGREAGGLNAVEMVVAGECKGIKKQGKANLFISDDMERLKRIYINDLTALQRQALALEYGLGGEREMRVRTATERTRLRDAKRAMYFSYISSDEQYKKQPNALIFFC